MELEYRFAGMDELDFLVRKETEEIFQYGEAMIACLRAAFSYFFQPRNPFFNPVLTEAFPTKGI